MDLTYHLTISLNFSFILLCFDNRLTSPSYVRYKHSTSQLLPLLNNIGSKTSQFKRNYLFREIRLQNLQQDFVFSNGWD